MKTNLIIASLLFPLFFSCKSGKRQAEQPSGEAPRNYGITEVWRSDTLLMTPESAIYDRARNVIYVSNLNFEPRMKDGNGFISILSAEGEILNLHWITGLSSPKGLAIVGDTLYTADVDEVVAMDINQGKIIRRMPVAGAGMLNDITSDSEGNLYISDSDAGKIHFYGKGLLTEWLTEGLKGPNGLLAEEGRLLVASQGSMDFAAIDLATKERTLLTDSVGRGDGIAFTGMEGYYFVSDWSGELFLIRPDNSKISLLDTKTQQTNTADIEFIPERNLLLVPTFFKNCIAAYELKEN